MSTLAHRRIVPPGYTSAELTLEGTAPILMNSGEVDRDGELYRAFYTLGQKRGKSLEDEENLRWMEWQLALYHDEKLGPYIPGKNVHEMLRAAATRWRKGEDIKRSLAVVENRIPLTYDGPREVEELWTEGYRYTAMVANAGMNRGRVVRCRPMFDDWSLTVELAYDPEDLDFDILEHVVERSQKYGLGDYRPTFGSFTASIKLVEKVKPRGKQRATKKRDPVQEKAHGASVKRAKAA